ncbi:MAG TPA: TA system VapC family ribonuclease toxin [Nitrospiraceae bacterium]|nr:TA system VapC family ribonuclease toxin [Nitrospiraceae bacterium]
MFVVDTNVFVYALNRSASEHSACRLLLEGWRSQMVPWYTTWGILYEVLRVASHPRVFRHPLSMSEVWHFLHGVLASPTIGLLVEGPRHAAIVATVAEEVKELRGNLIHDAHTAILMREHGIRRIYTRDTDFHRFPFLEVIDPLAR